MNQQTDTMTTTPKHIVEIGDPLVRTIQVPQRMDANALLWACAKSRPFIPASCRTGPCFPTTNDHMRDSPLPDPARFQSLRERIGYWETAVEHDDPEILLGAAVNAALNAYHDLMGGNPLAADPQRFIATVTEAAREWAEECFNTNTDH